MYISGIIHIAANYCHAGRVLAGELCDGALDRKSTVWTFAPPSFPPGFLLVQALLLSAFHTLAGPPHERRVARESVDAEVQKSWHDHGAALRPANIVDTGAFEGTRHRRPRASSSKEVD